MLKILNKSPGRLTRPQKVKLLQALVPFGVTCEIGDMKVIRFDPERDYADTSLLYGSGVITGADITKAHVLVLDSRITFIDVCAITMKFAERIKEGDFTNLGFIAVYKPSPRGDWSNGGDWLIAPIATSCAFSVVDGKLQFTIDIVNKP